MPDGKPPKQEGFLKVIFIFISCFFVSVATILGTGILALPVKVAQSGFTPFVVSFFVCLIMQGFVIFYMIELLQKTQAIQLAQARNEQQKRDSLAMGQIGSSLVLETTPISPTSNQGAVTPGDELPSSTASEPLPSSTASEPSTSEIGVPSSSYQEKLAAGEAAKANERLTKLIGSSGPDLHAMGFGLIRLSK